MPAWSLLNGGGGGTADWFLNQLAVARRVLPGISFATVYNSLRYLKNEGLIAEVRFGNESTRYDRKLTRHDHALCTECGDLVDLELPIPRALLNKAADLSKFEAQSVEFILKGVCPNCIQLKKKAGQRNGK